MATASNTSDGRVADVDYLVDERGSRIDVPADSGLRMATEVEQTVGATGPTNWWRLGLVALGIVAAILLVLQLFGAPGTDVVPNSPTAAPQQAAPQSTPAPTGT